MYSKTEVTMLKISSRSASVSSSFRCSLVRGPPHPDLAWAKRQHFKTKNFGQNLFNFCLFFGNFLTFVCVLGKGVRL